MGKKKIINTKRYQLCLRRLLICKSLKAGRINGGISLTLFLTTWEEYFGRISSGCKVSGCKFHMHPKLMIKVTSTIQMSL